MTKKRKQIKRLIKAMFIILILMVLNMGFKYSETTEINKETERYMKLYQDIYEKYLIQQIEYESEVIIPESFDFKYVEFVRKLSEEIGVPSRVMFRLIYKESTFNSNLTSTMGAKGLMQLMPETRALFYKTFRVDTLHLDKNQEDLYIGAYYLKYLHQFWRDRGNSEKNLIRLSLAAYNAGVYNVIQYKGVPPYKETQEFLNFILKDHSNPVFYSNILKKSVKKNIAQ